MTKQSSKTPITLTASQTEALKVRIRLTPEQRELVKHSAGIEADEIEVPVRADKSQELRFLVPGPFVGW